MTPLALLGEAGAAAVEPLFASDRELTWQLYVPPNYDSDKPAGLIVFVSRHAGGGGTRSWNPILEQENIIWIGAVGAGDNAPLNERMVMALLGRSLQPRTTKLILTESISVAFPVAHMSHQFWRRPNQNRSVVVYS